MSLGKKFEIKTKVGDNHTISLSEIDTIYKDESEESDSHKLAANIAKMKETYLDENGETVSEDYYVYFEIPYGEKSGGLALIPKLVQSYEENRNHTPRKYQYNYIGSMYYDKFKDALIYSKVCANKDVRKLIDDLNKKLKRFKVKDGQALEKPTFLEKMVDKFNKSGEKPVETREVKALRDEYQKIKEFNKLTQDVPEGQGDDEDKEL